MYRSADTVISSTPFESLLCVAGSATASVAVIHADIVNARTRIPRSMERIGKAAGSKRRATLTNARQPRNERGRSSRGVGHDLRPSAFELATDRSSLFIERDVAMPVVGSFAHDVVVDHALERVDGERVERNYDDPALRCVIHRSTPIDPFEIR